jgi:hypothetical protein
MRFARPQLKQIFVARGRDFIRLAYGFRDRRVSIRFSMRSTASLSGFRSLLQVRGSDAAREAIKIISLGLARAVHS